jgi:hypothetical protein
MTFIWYLYVLLRITSVIKIGLMQEVKSYLQKPFINNESRNRI